MPIPDPSIFRPKKLVVPEGMTVKEAKQAQLAACYGVPMPQSLTESEIAAMRAILAQHDREHQPMTTIDLNNPPKKPYQFQKFPKMVYNLNESYAAHDEQRPKQNSLGFETVHVPAKVVSAIVNSEEELAHAIEDGWSEQAPAFTEMQEEILSPRYQREADQIQEEIERRRPGRPKKTA